MLTHIVFDELIKLLENLSIYWIENTLINQRFIANLAHHLNHFLFTVL